MSNQEGETKNEEQDQEEESKKEEITKDYELLREDYPNYDLSFKVIVIGNSGNYFYIIYK